MVVAPASPSLPGCFPDCPGFSLPELPTMCRGAMEAALRPGHGEMSRAETTKVMAHLHFN